MHVSSSSVYDPLPSHHVDDLSAAADTTIRLCLIESKASTTVDPDADETSRGEDFEWEVPVAMIFQP
jgi:hypothetical protein